MVLHFSSNSVRVKTRCNDVLTDLRVLNLPKEVDSTSLLTKGQQTKPVKGKNLFLENLTNMFTEWAKLLIRKFKSCLFFKIHIHF